MNNGKEKSNAYWRLSIAVILVIGLSMSVFVGVAAGRNIKKSLLERTSGLAELIEPEHLKKLSGGAEDISSSQYKDLKQRFINLKSKNSDIRFVYILALSKDRPNSYFLLDSESPNSEDYSYPGQPYPEGDKDVNQIYKTGEAEVLPVTRDRWGVWLSGFSPIKDASGKVIAVLGLDIPAKSYYQSTLTAAAVPLLISLILAAVFAWNYRRSQFQQEFLAQKAFFLSFASHEIRSPLSSVAWALKILKNKTLPPEQQVTFLARTETSVRHILETIEEVLNLQGTESLKNKKLNKTNERIHGLITDTIDNLSLLATQKKRDIKDLTNRTDTNLMAKVDVALFNRVLSNLLVNAIKYSREDEPITVQLYTLEDCWKIEFHNGGEVLSKNDQAKIFNAYYRTNRAKKDTQQGTGLGLMLCNELIKRHKGTLSVTSNETEGTTFTITMPLS